MIKKIAHLADIHIRTSPTRHQEYKFVFDNLYKSLKAEKPDRIVIVGDLNNDYIDMQGEQLMLADDFLNKLSEIAPLIITRGNHDYQRKNKNRIDSIEAIVSVIKNSNITYYNKTGFYDDDNVTWAVWHHGEDKSPWEIKKYEKKPNQIYIDLYHDPIEGSKNSIGFEFTGKRYLGVSSLKGDYSFLGDIHNKQYFKNNKAAYPSSLICQNYGEGDDNFHGYLIWNIEKGTVKEIAIENEYSFKTLTVNPFTDFENLDIEIENPTKYMNIRIVWKTLPATRNTDNERKITQALKNKYNPLKISQKNEFIEENKIDVDESLTIVDIQDKVQQHNIFTNYLTKIGVSEEDIEKVLNLDDKISLDVEIEEFTNIQWSLLSLFAENFGSYESFDIDWKDNDGLYQIMGDNAVGKTTIFKAICFVLYGKTIETDSQMKHGNSRLVNKRNNAKFCEVTAIIEANGEIYGIKRRVDITKDKYGEINGAPTSLNYYKLENENSNINDSNSVNSLNEKDKNETISRIERIIGTYDTFLRVGLTTSDTLNTILRVNDKADFIDSLLYDSGLDIFDKKLNAFKIYQKDVLSKPRVSCDVSKSKGNIDMIDNENINIEYQIKNVEDFIIPEINERIKKGEGFIENLTKTLNKIDAELINFDINSANNEILIHQTTIRDYKEKLNKLEVSISQLKDFYDENKYNKLIEERNENKQKIYEINLNIKECNNQILMKKQEISIVNGEIFRFNQSIEEKEKEVEKLKNSKTCPMCKQKLDDNHIIHIEKKVNELLTDIEKIKNDIKIKKETVIPKFELDIAEINKKIKKFEKDIVVINENSEELLNEIGVLTNDKNEVEKRKEIENEISKIPLMIELVESKISIINQKIALFEKNKKQIDENVQINDRIKRAKEKLDGIREELNRANTNLYNLKSKLSFNLIEKNRLQVLIDQYLIQEKEDQIMNIYKDCVHRNGIPTQMLINHVIPKINEYLGMLLSDLPFSVWLDSVDLKLKLAYNNNIDAVIDAVSASGKERTFSSVALKFASIQINAKSRPTLLLLDEIMGKLSDNSAEEFIDVLHTIKKYMKKVLIVEHKHRINPDFVINVELNENYLSVLNLN